MKYLIFLFFASLTLGQIGSLTALEGRSVYAHDILLVFLIPGLLLSMKKTIKLPLLLLPLGAFLVAGILSFLWPLFNIGLTQTVQGSLYLWRWVLYSLLYLAVYFSTKPGLWWMEGMSVSGGIVLGLGFIQYFLFPDLRILTPLGWDPHFWRLTSTFLDPNFAGMYLVLTLFAVPLVLFRYPKIIYISAAVLVLGIYLTLSRSTYVALVTGLLVFAAVSKKTIVLYGIAVLAAMVFLLPKGTLDVTDIFRRETTLARRQNWKTSVALASWSPITGVGFNTLYFVSPLSGSKQEGPVVSRVWGGVDNSLILIFLTTGIIGTAAYGWIITKMVTIARVAGKRKEYKVAGAVLAASVTAVLVHSMFNNSLFYPWAMIWIMVLTASVEKITDGR